nr:hypothetical protein StreXyl84_64870 [Streptomyces sp. Xyl84]
MPALIRQLRPNGQAPTSASGSRYATGPDNTSDPVSRSHPCPAWMPRRQYAPSGVRWSATAARTRSPPQGPAPCWTAVSAPWRPGRRPDIHRPTTDRAPGHLGPVTARLSISTDTGHADVFTRLCDVDAQGRSVNVCDGLGRFRTTEETPSQAVVSMSSAAHRFAVGHRIRWQISGGAHPRYVRNPGTGGLPVNAAHFAPVGITVHAGSALMLPHSSGPA